jgi:cytochrome c oxidase assembly protein subunit 11
MSDQRPDNSILVKRLLLTVAGMFAFGFALVPLYQTFCDITGLGGRSVNTGALASVEVDRERLVTVELVATVNGGAAWEFRPQVSKMKVHPGELYTTQFYAENLVDKPQVGQASYNVAPSSAGRYFAKPDCFCFTKQQFEAREGRDMPVTFFIDPQLPASVETVTLSYTFYAIDG